MYVNSSSKTPWMNVDTVFMSVSGKKAVDFRKCEAWRKALEKVLNC